MDAFSSAVELARAIRTKRVSPVEVVDHYLERIDRLNPTLNAIIWRNDDQARRAARAAADQVVSGRDLPPFLGVPIPIKDLTPVKGWPTTLGSRAVSSEPSIESELVVEALSRAGFILLGRTNTPEFGPITVTENDRYGITRNPWATDRTPGGSSGGAGSATASGMVPLAHGNDGGGSIRIPSSCCGLVGLKPSRGRVPALNTPWEGAAVEGVLTRSLADAASVLDVISQPDPLCWYNAPVPTRPFAAELEADVGPLRVGMLEEAPLDLPVDPACTDALHEAARLLEGLGHKVESVEIEIAEDEHLPAFLTCVTAGYAGLPIEDWDAVEPHNWAGRAAGLEVNSLDYVEAVRSLQRMSRDLVAKWGRDFDLLLTPTMAIEPPEAGTVLAEAHAKPSVTPMAVMRMAAFTMAFNITGQPAISLPVHWTDQGIPIGAQLVAGPWAESQMIGVAAQVERAADWLGRRPPVS